MRIGVDIDGVLNNAEEFISTYGSKYDLEIGGKGVVNPYAYMVCDVFGWPDEYDAKFWDEHYLKLVKEGTVRIGASEIIKKLKSYGNEIWIVTARSQEECPHEKDRLEENIKNWLNKNEILFDNLAFNIQDKAEYCVRNNIEIMIEDSPHNILGISARNIPVICFDAKYNEKVQGDNILRAYNWYDVYSKLKKFEIQN